MIFYQTSNLSFKGLRNIQETLLDLYADYHFRDDTLLVIASLPSLDLVRMHELKSLIRTHSSIIFWCYGDLLWNIPFWYDLDLKNKKVEWVVSSTRWKNLALKFLPSENVSHYPHPFQLSEVKTPKMDEDSKWLFFAGRRNFSKNLPWLVRLWKYVKDQSHTPVKLALAGPWCDYQSRNEGFRSLWRELLHLYPNDLFDLGELSSQEVTSRIQASDVALSLSTFQEEDYGLFLREARTLGTPVVASHWGGHADLKDKGSFLIDIRKGFELEKAAEKVFQALSAAREKKSYITSREKLNPVPFEGFSNRDPLTQDEINRLMLGLEE